ncbi:hypothetical protein SH2C18_22170 [Clostridium sediminicola]|uniref:TolC family protein n=1 Tax=Clostridium sediminicola TaxID=3114879 RepID=UPI0031F1D6AD
MNKKMRKIITGTVTAIMALCSVYPTYASETLELNVNSDGILEFDVEAAVSYGLEHSNAIKTLDNKISLAAIAVANTEDNIDDLEDAEKALDDASSLLKINQEALKAAQTQLDTAKGYLKLGVAPFTVSFMNDAGAKVNITPGQPIASVIVAGQIANAEQRAFTIEEVKAKLANMINIKQDEIDNNKIAYEEVNKTFEINKARFEMKLEDTTSKIEDKIGYNTVITMDVEDIDEIMTKMADVNLDVTRYAKGIYKNKIVMLIKKNYYDALYAKKVMNLKKVAEERGKKQYELVKLSYENGMKAKDDLLLSKMYYDSTIIEHYLSKSTYKNAILELKKNMNLSTNNEITLVDTMEYEVTEESLNKGLESGLTNRLEIRQALGERAIYNINEKIINDMYDNENANTEASLLYEGSEIELEEKKNMIEAEIRKSYELMNAAGNMLNASSELIKNAEEVVDIARLKYEQGFGSENALLKDLNLEDNSGTIVEVIAAEEKLADVESKVANIQYSYTMAKVKFYNDSAILTDYDAD